MDAEPLIIDKLQLRAPDYLRVTEVRFVPGSFGTIEAGLGMGPVAERSVLGMTAPAQGAFLSYGIPVNNLPGPAVPFIIIAYLRNNNRNAAGRDIRTVLRDGDLHGIVFWVMRFFYLVFHTGNFT